MNIKRFKKNIYLSLGFMIVALLLIIFGEYQVSKKIIFRNFAQTAAGSCRNIGVDCIIDIPDQADPADYIFDVCVTDNNNPQSFVGGCIKLNQGGIHIGNNQLQGAQSFTVRVPITSLFASNSDISTTALQCRVTVKKRNDATCERRFAGDLADLNSCPTDQPPCQDCKCVEQGELQVEPNNGAIKYMPKVPQPTPDACYGDCRRVVVKRDIGGQIDLACEESTWIGEGGTASDRCITYTFNKERVGREGLHLCQVSPDAEGCSRDICCKNDPLEACREAQRLNAENRELCAVSDCQFDLVPDPAGKAGCPTCNGQVILGINQTILRRLTTTTRGAPWDDFEFSWGRFGENFEPIPPGERIVGGIHYEKGGTYELTLRCKKGNDFVTCTKYVPVVCASCGDQPPPPSPTSTPKPTLLPPSPPSEPTITPGGNSCPLVSPIQLQFSLDCKDCGISPSPTP